MKAVAEDYGYTFRMEPLHGSEARLSSLRHICSASSTCMCMVIIPYDTFLFVENFTEMRVGLSLELAIDVCSVLVN